MREGPRATMAGGTRSSVRVLSGDARTGADPLEVGGKAANLTRLESAGVVVPTWIVITAPMAAAGVGSTGAHAGAGDGDGLDRELAAALRTTGLDRRLLAVRSSAVGEDAEGASFAGQFETVLGVPGSDPGAVAAAVRRVRESAASERVLAYAGSAAPPRMAVILQALVDAGASGVAFSADPVTGDRGTSVVSAVRGLGEALVSGEVDADTFRVVADGDGTGGGGGGAGLRVGEIRRAEQERALRRTATGTAWVELTASERKAPAVSEEEVLEIVRTVRSLAGPSARRRTWSGRWRGRAPAVAW